MDRIPALAWAFAVIALAVTLAGWMLAKVSERPGVPREVGALPSWFAGESVARGAGGRPSSAAAPVETGAALERESAPRELAAAAVAAGAPLQSLAPEGEYVAFAGGRVEIAFKEYELTPSKIRVGPGKVTFVLRNEGRYSHDFHVEGPGIDITTQKFGPGRTIRLELVLQEGDYKISCPLSNHDERGMHGTLIVTSKLAGK